ncbi:catenin alpha-3 [Grus japonensis]|uniref:Catenin alpha-3 n=1 Tax=Grus japonensis TaxID=30415 RepID=A0ABC9X436_GRUJA
MSRACRVMVTGFNQESRSSGIFVVMWQVRGQAGKPVHGSGEGNQNLIILDPLVVNEEKIRPSLEKRLEAIISGAALLADSSCTRDVHRERIIAECNAIRQALQDLLSEYINNVAYCHEDNEV